MSVIIGLFKILLLAISFLAVVAVFFWPIMKLLLVIVVVGVVLAAIGQVVNDDES